MADVAPRVIDALLDAINTGDADAAAHLAREIASTTWPIRCPNCGESRFGIEQLTWNTQYYDAETDMWGVSEYIYEEDKPLRGVCAECDTDCTALLIKASTTTFYREPNWRGLEIDSAENYDGEDDDDDDGCPKNDPGCTSRADECHDACESPVDDTQAQPDEIRAVVSVACPVCEDLTPIAEATKDLRVSCSDCGHVFDVPRASIHDAQTQCLVALGEA